MKPTQQEIEARVGGQPLTQLCVFCNEPYRGNHTATVPVGYGRYRQFPAHVECARKRERELAHEHEQHCYEDEGEAAYGRED